MEEKKLAIANKQDPIYGEVEFIEEIDDLITYKALSEHFEVDEGHLNETIEKDRWLSFKIDGKELYVSKVAVRSEISWCHLYTKGLVYGTDDNGASTPYATQVANQYKTIKLNKKLYKCRLLKGLDPDLIHYEYKTFDVIELDTLPKKVNWRGHDLLETKYSEWNRLLYPIIIDDVNIVDYSGPRLASYQMKDLQLDWINYEETPGCFNWCQEYPYEISSGNDFNNRILRGLAGPSYLSWAHSKPITQSYGWRVVLELVE